MCAGYCQDEKVMDNGKKNKKKHNLSRYFMFVYSFMSRYDRSVTSWIFLLFLFLFIVLGIYHLGSLVSHFVVMDIFFLHYFRKIFKRQYASCICMCLSSHCIHLYYRCYLLNASNTFLVLPCHVSWRIFSFKENIASLSLSCLHTLSLLSLCYINTPNARRR